MRRSFQLKACLFVCVTLAAAPALAQKSPRSWTEMRAPEHGFSVLFPAPPRETKVVENVRSSWAVQLDNGFTAYLIAYSDLTSERVRNASASTILDDAVKGGQDRFPGSTRTSDISITLGGYSGREITLSIDQQGTRYKVKARVFLISARVYVLTAIGAENAFDEKEADEFLRSFALIAR